MRTQSRRTISRAVAAHPFFSAQYARATNFVIQQNFPNARVTYSFVWELWGRQTPDRNAAVDALFAAQGQ